MIEFRLRYLEHDRSPGRGSVVRINPRRLVVQSSHGAVAVRRRAREEEPDVRQEPAAGQDVPDHDVGAHVDVRRLGRERQAHLPAEERVGREDVARAGLARRPVPLPKHAQQRAHGDPDRRAGVHRHAEVVRLLVRPDEPAPRAREPRVRRAGQPRSRRALELGRLEEGQSQTKNEERHPRVQPVSQIMFESTLRVHALEQSIHSLARDVGAAAPHRELALDRGPRPPRPLRRQRADADGRDEDGRPQVARELFGRALAAPDVRGPTNPGHERDL
mmetsp:Transcript_23375/g.69944  ORF Transcript_23375/g.69944 Transcript_23375/m.69944 type:complete len:275 (+) Transcript_23375:758-1582(+)